jgi:hypothetical protein
MIIVAWNTIEFHVFSALPKGTDFDASDYTREMPEQIRKWRAHREQKELQRLIIHAENTRSQTTRGSLDFLEMNGMKKSFASTRLIAVNSFLRIF